MPSRRVYRLTPGEKRVLDEAIKRNAELFRMLAAKPKETGRPLARDGESPRG